MSRNRKYVEISGVYEYLTQADMPPANEFKGLAFVQDTGLMYVSNGTSWSSVDATTASDLAVVATVAALATIPSTYTTAIVKDAARGGVFNWSATGTANNGTIFVGLTGYWVRQYTGAVAVEWFGASPSASASVNAVAIQAALDGFTDVVISAGSYNYDTKLQISRKLNFVAEGRVELKFTGTGVACEISNSDASIYDVNFGGEQGFRINGNANCTIALKLSGVHHSKINVNTRNHTGAGIHQRWCVDNEIGFTCSSNEGAFTTTPTAGVIIDETTPGNYSVGNIYKNVVIEGVNGYGIDIVSGQLNVFLGGTSEGNLYGARIGGSYNTIENVWFEANTQKDIDIIGSQNRIVNVKSLSASVGLSCTVTTGEKNVFTGGFLRTVDLASGTLMTEFNGVTLSDNASLGIRGTGTYTCIGCYEAGTDGVITGKTIDIIGDPKGSWTPVLNSSGGGAQGTVNASVTTVSRIGKQINFSAYFSIAKGTLSAGTVNILGLPYTSLNLTNLNQYIQMSECGSVALGTGYTTFYGRIAPNSTYMSLMSSGLSVAPRFINLADLPDPVVLRFTGSYEIN